MTDHKKLRSTLRYYLAGKGWHTALKAMNFAEHYHTGTRKDGVTPEFDHQVRIAHFVRTLPDLMHPEETIATAFLHDVVEDYDVAIAALIKQFGPMITHSSEAVTKRKGVLDELALEIYFMGIQDDPIASIVKGADRIHNLQSMIGVFGIKNR